jgi:hypothetical protein
MDMMMDELITLDTEEIDVSCATLQLAKLYEASDVPLTSILDVNELWLTEAIVHRSRKHRDVASSPAYNSAATVLVKKVVHSVHAKEIEQPSSH